ncbi:MAG: DUF192 domain-containing protein [Candidatus Nitrosocaldus sp.]|nr:DUF192 domain-containing protein [Candidatus Nitrosocaldus sp.]
MRLKHLLIAVGVGAVAYGMTALLLPYITGAGDGDREYEVMRITVDGVPLEVEVADTDQKRALGLMHRERLDEGKGMLFIFPMEGRYSFWMMNMRFNIDILWIDSSGRVVYIVEDAEPCRGTSEKDIEECTYDPDVTARYVLEVNSGFVREHGIGIGSRMVILE